MTLSPQEYEQLYKQIRQDVLSELEQKRVGRSHWHELREKIEQYLAPRCVGSVNNKHKYQVGFTTLIRFILDVKRVENIKEEQLPTANEFIDELFELLDKYRAGEEVQ